jgi:hypothetical protein
MSPKVRTSAVLEETEEAKPVKNVRVLKEKAKIADQSVPDDDYEDEIEISPQKYISVISLCPFQLNLSTLPGGKGKVFSFEGFGQSKRIIYSNLVDIIDAFPRFLEQGYFYIADKKIIRRHGLNAIYDKLLTKETIENIFNKSMAPDEAANLYKSATKTQQETIISLLVRKMMTESANVDMNLVEAISKVSGIDLSKKVEEEKFYAQPQPVT